MANTFHELSNIFEPNNFEYLILILSPAFHLISSCLNSYPTLLAYMLANLQTFLAQNVPCVSPAQTVPRVSPAIPDCQCQQKTELSTNLAEEKCIEAVKIILKCVLKKEWESKEKLQNEIISLQKQVKELESKNKTSYVLNRKQRRL